MTTTEDDGEKTCRATSPLGFICTEKAGHQGDHCSDDPAINVTWDRWKRK